VLINMRFDFHKIGANILFPPFIPKYFGIKKVSSLLLGLLVLHRY